MSGAANLHRAVAGAHYRGPEAARAIRSGAIVRIPRLRVLLRKPLARDILAAAFLAVGLALVIVPAYQALGMAWGPSWSSCSSWPAFCSPWPTTGTGSSSGLGARCPSPGRVAPAIVTLLQRHRC